MKVREEEGRREEGVGSDGKHPAQERRVREREGRRGGKEAAGSQNRNRVVKPMRDTAKSVASRREWVEWGGGGGRGDAHHSWRKDERAAKAEDKQFLVNRVLMSLGREVEGEEEWGVASRDRDRS